MTGSSHWRRDIQGLRALAIIVVVLFHAGLPVPGGFIGVDVFFVISGYVITGMLRRDWQRDGRLRLRTFYARRFKRLTPALALTVSVTLLLSIVLLSPLGIQQTAAETGIGAMLLVANIVIARTTGGYFDLAAGSNPLLNTWSLSVEEQFYLVFPLILMVGWLLARRRGGRAWPTVLVAATAAASIAIMLATSRGGNLGVLPGELLGFYGPLTRVWEFAAGALLVIAAPRVAGRAGATAGALLGLLLVIASLWLISSETPGPGIRNLIPVVGTVLLLWAGQRDNPVSRALASRPAVAVGDISYSWYLWHWPLIVFSLILWPAIGWVAPAAALVSLVPSLVSYRWVEQPIRTRAVTGAASWTRLIAATSGPPIAIGVIVLLLCSFGYWSPAVRSAQEARSPHADSLDECALTPPIEDIPWDACQWNTKATGRPIVLVGDSNAGQFSEAVIAAGEALGRPVTIISTNGCPFMDVREVTPPEPGSCGDYVARAVDHLAASAPGTVLIGSSSLPYAPEQFASSGTFETGGPAPGVDYTASLLSRSVNTMTAGGQEVVLLQVLPHFTRDPYIYDLDRCTVWSLISGSCSIDMPRAFSDEAQQTMLAAYATAARDSGAPLLDLRDDLCPAGVCHTQRDGRTLYLDGGHISVEESAALAPRFIAALRR